MGAIAYAQTNPSLQSILAKIYTNIINPAILTLFAVALVMFFYGVIIYLRDAGEGEGRKKGKDHMVWSIVGFVIMIGVYGILNLLMRTFNITGVTISNEKVEIQEHTVPKVNLPKFKTN